MEFAKLCKKLEVRSFQLMSSVGADKDSWFLYPQTKGRVEHEVKELQVGRSNFESFVDDVVSPLLCVPSATP